MRSARRAVSAVSFAVCVASDLKERTIAAGKVRFRGEQKAGLSADQFRVIYTSDPFPPFCFGVPHNLPKDVRANVEKAFREFRFEGTSARKYAQQGKVGFAAVSYDKDWKYVREIDAALGRYAELK